MAKKVAILTEYLDYAKIFSKELVTELPKRSDINDHLIDPEPSK